MEGFLGAAYLWVKALHVVGMIAWMAAMLYLPRLFIYHCDAPAGSEQSETFKVMERRLTRAILNPAMAATWILGLLLMLHLEAWTEAWLHVKFTALLGMQGLHVACSRWREDFAKDANRHGPRFYRVMNEIPTVLLILIVVMAVVKPF